MGVSWRSSRGSNEGLGGISFVVAEARIVHPHAAETHQAYLRASEGARAEEATPQLHPCYHVFVMERTDVLPPERIVAGRYRLGRLLGEGGMGAVYEAEHLELGAIVAIKLLSDRYLGDADAVERFRREARAAAAIRHDHVVRVTDSGTDEEGTPFLVMERLEGESLGSLLKRHRRLPVEVAASVAREVLAGLEAAHAHGILHRDLKPGNIFLSREPGGRLRVKLLDFGISKLLDGASELTAEGAIVGTPHYMPPEQLRGQRDLDQRADLYAVGVLLFRMLGGQLPFEGQRSHTLYRNILEGRRRHLERLRPDVPEALRAVVDRALATDRDRRFPSARTMQEAIEGALPGLPDSLPERLLADHERPRHLPRTDASPHPSSPNEDPSTAPTLHASLAMHPGASARQRPDGAEGPPAPESLRDPTPSLPVRRFLPVVILAVALVAVVGWWFGRPGTKRTTMHRVVPSRSEGTAPTGSRAPRIPLLVVRYAAVGTAERDLGGLAKHLSKALGHSVTLRVLEPHDPVESVLAEEPAIAALSAYKYVLAQRHIDGLRLLATAVRRGGAWYQGLVVARADAGVQRLEDLRGHILCLVHETSTSGYLYPRAMLRKAGIDPDADLRAIRLTGDHLASLRALAHGACDAAAVYANALYKEAPRHGIDPGAFLVVAQSGRIPYDAYVASPRLPKGLGRRVREALLSLRPGSPLALRVLGGDNDLRGFRPATPASYRTVRELAEHMDAEAGASSEGSAVPPPAPGTKEPDEQDRPE